jgi:formate dehydrogenase subunit gamma
MPLSNDWDQAKAERIIASHRALEGAALPILHALQKEFGFVADEAVPAIAHALNVSIAEVHGVVTFYHDFRRSKAGRHVLRVCRAEACQASGGEALALHTKARLKVTWGETTSSGRVTLEPVFCLGLCATAPAIMVDDRPMGRMNAERIDSVIEGLQK